MNTIGKRETNSKEKETTRILEPDAERIEEGMTGSIGKQIFG